MDPAGPRPEGLSEHHTVRSGDWYQPLLAYAFVVAVSAVVVDAGCNVQPAEPQRSDSSDPFRYSRNPLQPTETGSGTVPRSFLGRAQSQRREAHQPVRWMSPSTSTT